MIDYRGQNPHPIATDVIDSDVEILKPETQEGRWKAW